MYAGFRLGTFVFERRLGSGGMAEVWLARNVHLGTPVAIKFLSHELAGRQDVEQRFLEEGRRQGGLDHPNIVKVYSFEYHEGRSFLVLQFIDGESLEDRLKKTQRLGNSELLQIAVGVLSALEFAHSRQIVHRDVKPSNIFIDGNRRVYLGDFGIVLALGEKRQTRAGSIIGTPEYMSPEQIMRPFEIDHRSDIYSFGCVLYEMLARRSPFAAAGPTTDVDFAIQLAHIQAAPTPLRQVNPAVSPECEAVVMRALAKEPNHRYQSSREFRDSLVRAMNPHPQYISDPGVTPRPSPGYVSPGPSIQPRPEVYVPPPGAMPRKSPWLAVMVAILCIAAVGGGLGYYGYQSRTVAHENEPKKTEQVPSREPERQSPPAAAIFGTYFKMTPLMPGTWTNIIPASNKQLNDELLATNDQRVLDYVPRIKQYRYLPLPFYDGTWLYEAETTTADGNYGLLTFLRGSHGITLLDGKSQTIYDMDNRAPLLIDTKERAEAYLRFFCGAIQSNEGTFVIAQKPVELEWRAGTDQATKDGIANLFSPFVAAPLTGGEWSATGTVAYGNGIFSSIFKVKKDGHVEMKEDVPVREQLPIARIHFVGPVRVTF